MNENTTLPRIRFVEAHPIQHEGRRMFLLQDPTGYTSNAFSVTPELLFVIQHMDGIKTVAQLQKAFENQFHQALEADDIKKVIEMLDEQYLLDNERFTELKEKLESEFVKSPIRPFSCFEEEDDPAPVRKFMDDAFEQAGFLPGPKIEPAGKPLAGLIAPHIDYNRGAKVYAQAYGNFFSQIVPGTVIIIGTNHQPTETPVILCDKDFETIFGRVPNAKLVVHEIAKQIDGKPFADMMTHQKEHSIELAASMIAYSDRAMTTNIVPILISGFNGLIEQGNRPTDVPEIRSLIEALKKLLAERPGEFSIIASADLAHVGRQFGDAFRLDDYHMKKLEEKDWESLALVCAGDAEGFFDYIAAEKDERKICGLGPIYVTLSALAPMEGTILGYGQWLHPDRDGSVTFCGVALEK